MLRGGWMCPDCGQWLSTDSLEARKRHRKSAKHRKARAQIRRQVQEAESVDRQTDVDDGDYIAARVEQRDDEPPTPYD